MKTTKDDLFAAMVGMKEDYIPPQHEALLTAQLSMTILGIWSQDAIADPTEIAETVARSQLSSGLRPHHVYEYWGAALTVAKFTARVAGLPIPKGAHTQ